MQPKEMGQFIAEVRKSRNMTQIELAEKLNVTDKAVSRWERGLGFPDIHTLEPLADALGVGIAELMQGKKNADAEPIRAEKVEEILLDTIRLSNAHSKPARVTGTAILMIFAVFAAWLFGVLVTDWNVLNLIVPSILAGLLAWAVPIWTITLSRNRQTAAAVIVSFASALSAVLLRIINLAHDINIHDLAAVMDTIDSEVIIAAVFSAITVALNVWATLSSRRRGEAIRL